MTESLQKIWNLKEIDILPAVTPAEKFNEKGLEAVFYDNVPWKGKPTKVFAWYGVPENASAENPVPAVILVHGGGGTAFADWSRHWIKQGFAVLAMDNCGGTPGWSECPWCKNPWPRHEFSGPEGWGCPTAADERPEDQWLYHAVSSVIRAKNILMSKPEVQKDNISLNGISWGAVICCLATGLDNSFRCAVPVYGCGGFALPESGLYHEDAGKELNKLWFGLWDPDHYLPSSTVPSLFVAGTGDVAFPMGAWCNSTKLPAGKVYRSLRPDYPHDHTISWQSHTINNFVRSMADREILPEIMNIKQTGKTVTFEFNGNGREIKSAQIFITRATGAWQDRRWSKIDAVIDGNTASAELPPTVTVCYAGIRDDKECFWTSDIIDII